MFRSLAVVGLMAVVAGFAPAADRPLEELFADSADVAKAATDLLTAALDDKAPRDAKAKFDQLGVVRASLRKRLQEGVGQPVVVKDPDALGKAAVRLRDGEKALTEAHHRLFTKAKATYAELKGNKLFAQIEADQEAKAAEAAKALLNVVKNHMVKNGGDTPTNLAILALGDSAKGVLPLLAGGAEALNDPWGFPFQYAVGQDKSGAPDPHVWTVSPYSEKKLGNPPPAK